MSVQAGEQYRFEQSVRFDGHLFGSDEAYPNLGQCEIRRGSDGFYWDGAAFVSGQTWNDTVVDASGLFHYYDWTVPGGAANGDTFILRIRVTDDADTEAVGNMIVRPASGSTATRVFDGVDFATGFPSTVGI